MLFRFQRIQGEEKTRVFHFLFFFVEQVKEIQVKTRINSVSVNQEYFRKNASHDRKVVRYRNFDPKWDSTTFQCFQNFS